MDNLCKYAIGRGGILRPLLIPSGESGGLGLTNPTVFYDKLTDKLLVNIRHVQYALYHSEGEQKFQTPWGPLAYLNPEDDITLTTKNYLCEINQKTLFINTWDLVDTSEFDVTPLWEFVGLEDCRLVRWDSTLYLSGVRRDTTTNGVGRIELSSVEDCKETSRVRIEPPSESYCEKNWMPVEDLPYHYVKWSNPTEVVKVDFKSEKATAETVVLKEQSFTPARDIRGGSQVITIGDFRVTITHEVDLWQNEQNRKDAHYYHRIIVWDKDWNLVHQTSDFKFLTGHIEFCCGMTFVPSTNEIVITFGFQDSTAYILKMGLDVFEDFVRFDFKSAKEKVQIYPAKMPEELENFVNDPYDQKTNSSLGKYYFQQGHYASSLSFYLRAAEYGSDKDLTYQSLIRVAESLSLLGRRSATELGLWLNALSFDPQRVEAYFYLSQYWERQKNYHFMYNYATIGESVFEKYSLEQKDACLLKPYHLLFNRAVSAWWIGRAEESRELFQFLAQNMVLLPEEYQRLIQQNLQQLGTGRDLFVPYFKGFAKDLKFPFEGLESISKNYSQTYQDMFVLAALNGKKDGYYLEIGSADPFKGSNSALLEELGWAGVSVEISESEVAKFRLARRNPVLHADALTVDYKDLLANQEVVDYLQIDCEPPGTSFEILKLMPFDQTRFAVITFEHDAYADSAQNYRELSREFLIEKGYVLVAGNIAPDKKSCYEDWWVHPELVPIETISILRDSDKPVLHVKDYMLN